MPAETHSRKFSGSLAIGGQRCLLLGAKGAGMTALAEILAGLRHHVTGLDSSITAEVSSNSRVSSVRLLPWTPYSLSGEQFDLCVASPAIASSNALLEQLRNAGTPILSLHECLAAVFRDCRQICVAGTHGKSTTSAMVAWIMDHAGMHPGFFVGAHQTDLACSGRAVGHHLRTFPKNGLPPVSDDWCVLESCEFSRSFRHFSPQTVVLTGIERDHFDCFPDQQSEDAAFQEFVGQLPATGTLIYNVDCSRSFQIATAARCLTTTFQLLDDTPEAIDDVPETVSPSGQHWVAQQIQMDGRATTFLLKTGEQSYSVRLAVPGRHNVSNAVAAILAAVGAGVSIEECCEALAAFCGIRRRFEVRGLYNGITLVDDYAHHPTAIKATLQTAREVFPGRRIIAAVEPHQMVRTRTLFPEFVDSLCLADEILMLPVFPARETVTYLECCRISGRLVRELNNRGNKAFLFANLDQIVSRIDHSGKPTDILLTMGAGRTNLIHDELTRRLQRHSVA